MPLVLLTVLFVLIFFLSVFVFWILAGGAIYFILVIIPILIAATAGSAAVAGSAGLVGAAGDTGVEPASLIQNKFDPSSVVKDKLSPIHKIPILCFFVKRFMNIFKIINNYIYKILTSKKVTFVQSIILKILHSNRLFIWNMNMLSIATRKYNFEFNSKNFIEKKIIFYFIDTFELLQNLVTSMLPNEVKMYADTIDTKNFYVSKFLEKKFFVKENNKNSLKNRKEYFISNEKFLCDC